MGFFTSARTGFGFAGIGFGWSGTILAGSGFGGEGSIFCSGGASTTGFSCGGVGASCSIASCFRGSGGGGGGSASRISGPGGRSNDCTLGDDGADAGARSTIMVGSATPGGGACVYQATPNAISAA